MKINQVMKKTGLTKKAIYYYENEGLISPEKKPGNNYRIYTDDDVRTLIKINILRRLDVPIKSIGEIINHGVSIKDILKDQLSLTNHKINVLFQNKMILNELITKDMEDSDFSFNTLKDFDLELDKIMVGSGYLGKELERIFPGTLGKILAIFYNNFLNVPLDTEEKVSAWNDLVSKLDEMQEIDYPDDIRIIVDEIYGEVDRDRIDYLEKISKQVIDAELGKQIQSESEEILMTKESMEGYYANPENQRKIEGYYNLQNFILNNLYVFKEIDQFIGIINDRYRNYMSQSPNSSKTR